MPIPDIRRVYRRPWHNGSCANAGKVSAYVQVAVRPQTTVGALEAMPGAPAQSSTARAGLAAVSRIDVLDCDSGSRGLVLDEGLKLPESPAMQPGAHAFARLDAGANMRQVFHHDLGHARRFGGPDSRRRR